MSGYGATAPLAPGSVVVPLKETGFDVGEGMLNKTSPEELHQLVKVYNKWFAWGYDKMLTVVLFLCMLLAPFVGMAAAMMAVCTQVFFTPFVEPLAEFFKVCSGRGGAMKEQLTMLQVRYYEETLANLAARSGAAPGPGRPQV